MSGSEREEEAEESVPKRAKHKNTKSKRSPGRAKKKKKKAENILPDGRLERIQKRQERNKRDREKLRSSSALSDSGLQAKSRSVGRCKGKRIASEAERNAEESSKNPELHIVEYKKEDLLCPSKRFPVGCALTQGRRAYMEDVVSILGGLGVNAKGQDYFAVFDGHGGKRAAEVAAANLHINLIEQLKQDKDAEIESALKIAFLRTNQQILSCKDIVGGTTACVVYCHQDRVLLANVGDSRAIFIDTKTGKTSRITIDHKPNNKREKKRIVASGGTVTSKALFLRIPRINGELAVARALGDAPLKRYLTAEPDVFEVTDIIKPDRDCYIVIASDGLWDVCSDSKAGKLVMSVRHPGEASKKLREFAFQRGSADNISVVVIKFPVSS